MSRGIIMYNQGQKLAVRLSVALSSLRKYYSGPITLLSEGKPSHAVCEPLASKYEGTVFINATLVGEYTPYDTTLWLDADTLTRGDFWTPMFEAAERSDFAICQISNWTTAGKIAKRIKSWSPIYPEWIEGAIGDGTNAAINCGVFAFTKKSKLMRKWYKICKQVLENNQGVSMRYPDESCCQLILHRFKHEIMSHNYNYHCRADKGIADDAMLVHYCGGKHCRIKKLPKRNFYQYHSKWWYNAFDEISNQIPYKWIGYDRQLRQNIGKHDG